MVQKIVVALDGSACAEKAVPVAVEIARATDSELILVGVVADTPPVYAPCFVRPDVRAHVAHAQAYLERIARSVPLAGVRVQPVVRRGTAVAGVLAEVEAQRADLVVMSSHGRTGVSRWMLGSVASQMVRQSPVPVLVVTERNQASALRAIAGHEAIRALVALDGSPEAEAAIEPAMHLLSALAPATVAHVLHLARIVASPGSLEEARAYLTYVAAKLEDSLAAARIRIETTAEASPDAATRLIEIASQQNGGEALIYAFIAVATRGRREYAPGSLENVAARLLVTSPTPVVTVEPRRAAERVENVRSV